MEGDSTEGVLDASEVSDYTAKSEQVLSVTNFKVVKRRIVCHTKN